jgi:hypothetical protein
VGGPRRDAAGGIDPGLLERLRHSGLRLDREGRWWHEGQRVTHAGLARALHRWLDRLEDGRFVVRLDARRLAYVEVEDAPYAVRRIRVDGRGGRRRVWLLLSDGSEEELDYGSLAVSTADNALYCRVKGGLLARFSRPAYYRLAELIEPAGGGFVLRAAAARWPIGKREGE